MIEKNECSEDHKLPLEKAILDDMNWHEGDTLQVTKTRHSIHLTKIVEDI